MVVRVDILVLALRAAEAISSARLAITSLAFILRRGAGAALDEVGHELVTHLAGDEPVAGGDDGGRRSWRSSTPRSRLASAAAFFT